MCYVTIILYEFEFAHSVADILCLLEYNSPEIIKFIFFIRRFRE